ncbi:toll/interleukin-1 receptor domain-containing protein [uncultured Thiothrix sp.]|uniref:toll/interleukin-1 receptor domain-containing protein n=1 Tax=uncultured Thiothrix sp. TaxID=223185 RepID=UPI002602E5B4|nr:TIR domain-containing protein [uncultured Thiothrix sp.]
MVDHLKYDIALSFAGEDRQYVDQVATLLRDSGVRVFYDHFEEANLWGKNLYDYLVDIYKSKAKYTIMFISTHYAKKLWTNHERQAMQARAFGESQEYILPARFDDTPIPGVLPTIGYISLIDLKPAEFVKTIQKKLVINNCSIPSELHRMDLLVKSIPRLSQSKSTVTALNVDGDPICNAKLIALASNKTTKEAYTSADGLAVFNLPVRRKYTILFAHPDYRGAIYEEWDPEDDLILTLDKKGVVGSIVFNQYEQLPNLKGYLQPILDTSNRTYLYARNIAINDGLTQPVSFKINEIITLEDAEGAIVKIEISYIQGVTCLINYSKVH